MATRATKKSGIKKAVPKKAPAKRSVAKKAPAKRARTRQRRTYFDLFLDRLQELTVDQQLISNATLRDALGWDDSRYLRVRTQLLSNGQIIIGRGQGGSVGLAGGRDNQALKVFVSYSHADEKHKDAIIKHLKPLERMGLISEWHDRKLLAGDDFGAEISKNLEKADLILLLISIDFINSKYCYDLEMDRAIERHEEGSCKVVPVILRGCLWQHTPFSKLLAMPRDGKPVMSWPDVDEAYANVADGIRLAAEAIISIRE
jgi:hypothetical protein